LYGINPFGLVNQSWRVRGRNPSQVGSGFVGFGSVCGSGSNAKYIPDGIFSQACQSHDDCYDACGASKIMCDLKLLAGVSKSGGNTLPGAAYFWAVTLAADDADADDADDAYDAYDAYEAAQEKACEGDCGTK